MKNLIVKIIARLVIWLPAIAVGVIAGLMSLNMWQPKPVEDKSAEYEKGHRVSPMLLDRIASDKKANLMEHLIKDAYIKGRQQAFKEVGGAIDFLFWENRETTHWSYKEEMLEKLKQAIDQLRNKGVK